MKPETNTETAETVQTTSATAVDMPQLVRQLRVYRDDTIPAFGGWYAGSLKDGDPTILLNVAACLLPCVDDEGTEVSHTVEEKKWLMISTLMHEFGHALQEFFDLEFTEARIEELVTDYERHYLTNAQGHAPAE